MWQGIKANEVIRNTHALYARYVHRNSPVKASHRWMGESLPVLTRLKHKMRDMRSSLHGYEGDVIPCCLVNHHLHKTIILIIHSVKTINVAH
jgi:hypothetical protein